MKLTLEDSSRVNLIRSYSATGVRVGEQTLQASCIVTSDTVIPDWGVPEFAQLTVDHLQRLFALRPEVVLLGTGATQRFPSQAIRAAFSSQKIGLEVMDLGAACRTFNVLVQEERQVAAALLFY